MSDEVLEDYPDRQGAPIYQPPARGGASSWTPPAPPPPPVPERPADPAPVDDDPADDQYFDEFDADEARALGDVDPRSRFFPGADPGRPPSAARPEAQYYPQAPPAVDPHGYPTADPRGYQSTDLHGYKTPDPRGYEADDPQGYEDLEGQDERDFEGDSGGYPVVEPAVREVRGVPPKDVRDAPARQSPWEESPAAQGDWGAPGQAFPTQRPVETPLPMSSPFGASPTYPTYAARPPGTDLVMRPAPQRKRSPLLVLLLIVVVAVVGGGVAAVVAFAAARPGHGGAGTTPTPAPAASLSGGTAAARTAPQNLKIRDDSTSVTLTWTDPTTGTVPFIVAGGQQGAMGQLESLTAGTTTYTINGLNPRLDYCFTVAAVYDTQTVALSQLACTRRASASPKR